MSLQVPSDISGAYRPEEMCFRLGIADGETADASWKGIPPSFRGSVSEIGAAELSLAKDIPLPVALLRERALRTNRAWMKHFLGLTGALIAPHGKTTMSPRLLQAQLEDGAWGITAATAQQVALFASFGVSRIIMANQLIGEANIRIVLDLIQSREDFDFYCLVDSIEGVSQLADAVRARRLSRPLQLLVEIGAMSGRTGVRGVAGALQLARAVHGERPALSLRGIEAYEGIFSQHEQSKKEANARAMLAEVQELATLCHEQDLFDDGPVILTAGGTEFFDLAAIGLTKWTGNRPSVAIVRSGCYLTHDDLTYERAFQRLLVRSSEVASIDSRLTPALEVWGAVQSRPEPNLAFATLGKRDISFDMEMPIPIKWWRPATMACPQTISRRPSRDRAQRPTRISGDPRYVAARRRRSGWFRRRPCLHDIRQMEGAAHGRRRLSRHGSNAHLFLKQIMDFWRR